MVAAWRQCSVSTCLMLPDSFIQDLHAWICVVPCVPIHFRWRTVYWLDQLSGNPEKEDVF